MSSAPKLDDVLEEEEGEERLIDGDSYYNDTEEIQEDVLDVLHEDDDEEHDFEYEDDSLEDVNEEDESETGMIQAKEKNLPNEIENNIDYQLSSESLIDVKPTPICMNIEIVSDISNHNESHDDSSSSCSSSPSPISPSSLLSSSASSNSSINSNNNCSSNNQNKNNKK